MGKLIDADKLKSDLNEKRSFDMCDYDSGLLLAIKVLERQPEAYSVEKVVEALETEAFRINNKDVVSYAQFVELKEAIEIVRRGGKNEIN